MKVAGKHYRSLWADEAQGVVHIIDQTRLPHVFETRSIGTVEEMAEAIKSMRVRGAPLIGVAATFGIALAVARDPSDESISRASALLRTTRPTAVNLAWAIGRMRERLAPLPLSKRFTTAWDAAQAIADQDVALNEAIGRHGLALLEREYAARKRPVNILTHCNAGWVATVDWGTVTAPIFMAHDRGIPLHVWVDETRPRNQGLLTAWELAQHGVAVNSLWPRTTIATAAIEVNFPAEILKASRKPAIMADAAYVIFNRDSRRHTGRFYVDEAVLREEGVTDFEQYAVTPGAHLYTDLFLE